MDNSKRFMKVVEPVANILEHRGKQYERDAAPIIASLWNAYLETGWLTLNSQDVYIMMALMKIGRGACQLRPSEPRLDSLQDAIGYLALALELESKTLIGIAKSEDEYAPSAE
jgi:hypothetical protein